MDPDGRRLIFGSERFTSALNLSMQAADGTGSPIRLTGSLSAQSPTSVSRDGQQIVFNQNTPNRQQRDLRLFTFAPAATASGAQRPSASRGGGAPSEQVFGGTLRPLLETRFEERGGVLSPDDRWLAYESNSSGTFEVYVRPFPNVGDGQWQVSTGGGVQALWSHDGRELFYIAPDGALMVVAVSPAGNAWRAGAPATLSERPYYTGGDNFVSRHYDITADGKRFIMVKEAFGDQAGNTQNLVVVQNWTEELKRLVPNK